MSIDWPPLTDYAVKYQELEDANLCPLCEKEARGEAGCCPGCMADYNEVMRGMADSEIHCPGVEDL